MQISGGRVFQAERKTCAKAVKRDLPSTVRIRVTVRVREQHGG